MSYGTIQAEKMTTESGYSLGAGNASSFKNRIINGGMTISQRDGTTAVTVNSSNSAFCPDRFNGRIQQASGAMTMQQSTTAPAGFVNSLLMTVTNTTAPASGNRVHVRQIIEGNNIADLAWGTADAKPIVLSFWVRSSITGTYGVGFINSAENRSYVGTYTVNSANTWEYKTISVTGDTSGTWLTDNSNGIRVTFDLGSGSSYNASSANTWVAQEACRTSSCVNWQQNSGATLYLTGVQLEVGTVATSFDFRSYGTELQLCQRYYQQIGNSAYAGIANALLSGTRDSSRTVIRPTVDMRSAPSVGYSNIITTDRTAFDTDITSTSGLAASTNAVYLNFNHAATGTAYYPVIIAVKNSTTGYVALSAEL